MTKLRWRASWVAAVCALALSGCADGIEFNGKIFDALGMSGSGGPRAEPKVAQRSPLTLPPDSQRLPEPGSAPVATAGNESWPVDPDQKKLADAAETQRKQQEYCRDGNWKEKAIQDEVGASQGPSSSCGSIFKALSKSLSGSD